MKKFSIKKIIKKTLFFYQSTKQMDKLSTDPTTTSLTITATTVTGIYH